MLTYIFRQILILGIIACVAWLAPAMLQGRFSLNADVLFVLFVSFALTGFFLVAVCLPVAKFARQRVGRSLFYLIGACCGPLAVLGYLFIFMNIYPEWSQYFVRFWKEHSIFSFVGLVFFIGLYPRLGPEDNQKGSKDTHSSAEA